MKKHRLNSMKARVSKVTMAAFFAAGAVAYAGLQIPYTPDADTLHLWHFDSPTNTITTTDEVQTASITLTNYFGSGTVVTLGSPSVISQLGTCLDIIPPSLSSGSANGLAVNGAFWPDATPFCNATSGAFTMEAIVKCTGNPYVANGNWEIVCGDSSAGTGSRSWQFRIQTGPQPQLDFNFITVSGANFLVNLPKSGPNILLQGIWYHVAVTYTGNSPTNGDTAGILRFYWTVLDGGRTNASILTNIVTAGTFTLGGTPLLGIGGSGRNLASNPANGEGFKGYIDEVRISDIARSSNQMAFVIGGSATPPAFLQQPPTNTFVGYGQSLSLPALVTGVPTFYWYHAGTNLPAQTDSSLFIPSVTFADGGSYQLVASNSLGSVTSVVAQVTIGAEFSELFNTGIDTNGALAAASSTDTHYKLIESGDPANLGPSTLVWDMGAYPIAASGGNFANPDGSSQWIGPQANSYVSPVGEYTYRIYFLLDSVDLTQPATLTGVWWVNELGTNILINGHPTGFGLTSVASSSGKFSGNFTITSNFVSGLNTLDFVTERTAGANGSYQESALRVEISGLGQALPPGLPIITNQPQNQTVVDGAVLSGSVATFSVVALGRPPLSYQWWADGTQVTGATNRTLVFDSPSSAASPGTNFTVVVSNDSGSVTSSVAVLTLIATNQPPVVASFSLFTYSNAPVNFNLDTAFRTATDADNDPLTLGTPAFDAASTNGAVITQNGVILTYTPNAGFVGADEFNYYVSDSQGANTAGAVTIQVEPLLSPTVATTTRSGNNVVLTGFGGAANLGYHVLSSTNVTTPLTNWIPAGSGLFDGTGHFSFTNSSTASQNYYIIQIP